MTCTSINIAILNFSFVKIFILKYTYIFILQHLLYYGQK
jgi:hypothetical protein